MNPIDSVLANLATAWFAQVPLEGVPPAGVPPGARPPGCGGPEQLLVILAIAIATIVTVIVVLRRRRSWSVRGAAALQGLASPAAASSKQSIDERLRALARMRTEGLVSDSDYESKRAQILREL